ncbi:MAG: branched-chain amino acid aminotransferase [Deltaproteobacteria bacterium]|nr:branched-chain amino acid aminotransferase [Deltaproteobacteria bacterium]
MDMHIQTADPAQRRPKPADESHLGFGKIYSDHMFLLDWTREKGWHGARITPYQPLAMDPATLVLHYGQSIFEGLKAYRNPQGNLQLFRPAMNWARMTQSAQRLSMPALDEAAVTEGLGQLLTLDHDWVPRSPGTSLYIRPTMIAMDPYVGLKSSSRFLFFIITSPVGAYYPEGFNPVKIQVCERYSRAGPGGLGQAKTAANYAASLLAQVEAAEQGYTQVLWLDACNRKYLEEVGAMNIMVKIGGKVITPPVAGTILAGVTRDSVIHLLRHWKIPVEERPISIDEVTEAQKSGQLEEIFGCGTAAVISPVGLLNHKERDYVVGGGKTGPTAQRLFDELVGIQYGTRPDPFGWVEKVKTP